MYVLQDGDMQKYVRQLILGGSARTYMINICQHTINIFLFANYASASGLINLRFKYSPVCSGCDSEAFIRH